MYIGYQEQMEYLDFVLDNDYDAKPREIHIREMAADAIARAEVYTVSGLNVVVRYGKSYAHRFVRENDPLPAPGALQYRQINVRLVPALQGSPYVAQLLAEQQLRAEWP